MVFKCAIGLRDGLSVGAPHWVGPSGQDGLMIGTVDGMTRWRTPTFDSSRQRFPRRDAVRFKPRALAAFMATADRSS